MNIINRNAFHNYEFVHSYEAGIVLSGCEVKSIVNAKFPMHMYSFEMEKLFC